MKKYVLLFLCLVVSILSLSSCGKTTLETGEAVSESSVLKEGRFSIKAIDTSFIVGNYYENAEFTGEDHYSYILTSYNSSLSASLFYFIRFNLAADSIISDNLDLPISVNDGKAVFSSLCNDIRLSISSLPVYDNSSVNYYGFKFNDDGSFSGYCNLYGQAYSESMDDIYYVYNCFVVNWDEFGKCISIVNYSDDLDISNIEDEESDEFSIIIGKDGKKYKTISTGIAELDSEDNYSSKYFDFYNSNINSLAFISSHIVDSDHFSGIYLTPEGERVLACFTRDTMSDVKNKAIVLACTDIDSELKASILRFNNLNNGFKIAVYNYSDRINDNNSDEAWYLLKADLLNGYRPDFIYNNTGYDKYFVDQLVQGGALCDLKKIINDDKDLKGIEFDDKAVSLFYPKDNIYALIPSYRYETVIGRAEEIKNIQHWGTEEYFTYAGSIMNDISIFPLETDLSFISEVLRYNGYNYIDYKNRSASFDDQEFISFLEYAYKLPRNFDEAMELYYSVDIVNGYSALADMTCSNLGDMYLDSTKFCKGIYVDLGFPRGVSQGSGVISASGSFMIISGRAYTNECWSFIKKYLTDDYQTSLRSGIPVTVSGYNAWFNDRQASATDAADYRYINDDGNEIIVYCPFEEDVQYITDNINSCNAMAFSDYRIEQIVMEYAEQYFEDEITAEDAAKSIDKDVEAYLNS